MAGFLDENHIMIQKTLREIVNKEIAPIAGEIDEKSMFPRENINKLAKGDFLGISIPQEYDGVGADRLSYVLGIEEISKGCASTALVTVAHSFVSQGLMVAGRDDQKEKYLPPLARGDKLGAFAVHESNSGCSHTTIEAQAELKGDYYVLNGSKFTI